MRFSPSTISLRADSTTLSRTRILRTSAMGCLPAEMLATSTGYRSVDRTLGIDCSFGGDLQEDPRFQARLLTVDAKRR